MSSHSIFYFLAKNSFHAVFSLYNRLQVVGREHIPDCPVIVASNHVSNIDPPLIGGIFPRRLRYLAKESLFRNPVLGFLIASLGAIPVTREDRQRAGVVLKLLLDQLQQGESILLFPEGSRSKDGKLQPLEGGAAFRSVKSGVPILPVYIRGSRDVCPPGSSFPHPAKLQVRFAAPLSFDPGLKSDREKRDLLMKRLDETLHALGDERD